MELERKFGFNDSSLYGYDKASISILDATNENITLERQIVGAYSTKSDLGLPRLWLGRLGLSKSDIALNTTSGISFLYALKRHGHVQSLSFEYQAGAAYRKYTEKDNNHSKAKNNAGYNKVPGSLILGGHDRSRQSGESITIPWSKGCTVGLQSITTTLRGGSIKYLNYGILAILETDIPELWLPHNVCDQIASVLNFTYHDDLGRYTMNDNAHEALQSLNGSLEFRIGSNIRSNSSILIDIPYKAFDLEASWPIFNSNDKILSAQKSCE